MRHVASFSAKHILIITGLLVLAVSNVVIGYYVSEGTYDLRGRAQTLVYCGNNTCDAGETCEGCSADCGICHTPTPTPQPTPTPICIYNGSRECSIACGTTCEYLNGCYVCPPGPTCGCRYSQFCKMADGNTGTQTCAGICSDPNNCSFNNNCVYDQSGSCGSDCTPCQYDSTVPTPTPTIDPCPGQHNLEGGCDPACCSSDGQCPTGQLCNISNGNCASTLSCNPILPTPTPTPYCYHKNKRDCANYCAEVCSSLGGCWVCPGDPTPSPPTPTPTPTIDPCPGQHNLAGGCDPACCSSNGQCPSGQKCNISNGNCQSNLSCNPAVPTPTNIPSPTPTPAPLWNTCNGEYNFSSGLIRQYGNYGDPYCNYNKDSLYNLIKQLDPANIDIWWNLIIRKESQYDPNAVNENRIECPTEICFGLFQMGSGVINGPIDNGYTDWVAQAKNAVAWNNNLASKGCQWTYWGTAKNLWPNNPECYK